MLYMHGNFIYMFDCCANPVVHLLLKIPMAHVISWHLYYANLFLYPHLHLVANYLFKLNSVTEQIVQTDTISVALSGTNRTATAKAGKLKFGFTPEKCETNIFSV